MKKFLNGVEELTKEVQDGKKRSSGEGYGLLSECITREEVMWLLQEFKMKAAAGKVGITVKMMNREVLVDLWWELFNWCWGRGMVPPSMWKSRMVVLVPKTRSKQAGQKSSVACLWCQ